MRRLKVLLLVVWALLPGLAWAQPANDACDAPEVIAVPAGGFGMGSFSSSQVDITAATVQPGEYFDNVVQLAGQTQRSAWFAFTIGTNRSCRVTVRQPGAPTYDPTDVGFTVYLANRCLPGLAAKDSGLLAPQALLGSSFNGCLPAGRYLVQVCGSRRANGLVQVQLDVGTPSAAPAYDVAASAYAFSPFAIGQCQQLLLGVHCLSVDDATELDFLGSYATQYPQSAWFTFTTPASFDELVLKTTAPVLNFYQGDVRSVGRAGLAPAQMADTAHIEWGTHRAYGCDALQPATTYSAQVVYEVWRDEIDTVRMLFSGSGPTLGPRPDRSAIAASNQLGALTAAPRTAVDRFSCNSFIARQGCAGSAMKRRAHMLRGGEAQVNTWFTFRLTQTSQVNIASSLMQNQATLRVYKTDLAVPCAVDSNQLVAEAAPKSYNSEIFNLTTPASLTAGCLEPGDYTLQVLGPYSTLQENMRRLGCDYVRLGVPFTVTLSAQPQHGGNRYDLRRADGSSVYLYNGGASLQNSQAYTSLWDTLGCARTVLPQDIAAQVARYPALPKVKAIYHEFEIGDMDGDGRPDSTAALLQLNTTLGYLGDLRLYRGSASALSVAQNAHAYPQTLTGLAPLPIVNWQNIYGASPFTYVGAACLLPGRYTLVTPADSMITYQNARTAVQPVPMRARTYAPALAEDMGSVVALALANTQHQVTSQPDLMGCRRNAVAIDGRQPCDSAVQASYRQFYLSQPADITLALQVAGPGSAVYASYYTGGGMSMSLFAGKATEGLAGLHTLDRRYLCQSNFRADCLPTGWYTVAVYGRTPSWQGATAGRPDRQLVGSSHRITLTINPLADTKFGTPATASVDPATGQPYLIVAGALPESAAYPSTSRMYALAAGYLGCAGNIPADGHLGTGCGPKSYVRSYYVFRTQAESHLKINIGTARWASVYDFDVRTDSARLATRAPIQPCVSGSYGVDLSRVPAGSYTLVITVDSGASGPQQAPQVYIDHMATSRFDFAAHAYDFGQIRPNAWQSGRPGDTHPTQPGRAPSHDFITSLTAAAANEPSAGAPTVFASTRPTDSTGLFYLFKDNQQASGRAEGAYYTAQNPARMRTVGPRRTLWYSFTLLGGGNCTVRVRNTTPGDAAMRLPFQVLASDADGRLSVAQLRAGGQLDSTLAQGLTNVAANRFTYSSGYAHYLPPSEETVTFARSPCEPVPTRYFVRVEAMAYNPALTQVEVDVRLDSNLSGTRFYDHVSTANAINGLAQTTGPYTPRRLGSGTYTGQPGPMVCATLDSVEIKGKQEYFGGSCGGARGLPYGTLWYTFEAATAGTFSITWQKTGPNAAEPIRWKVFRQEAPGDTNFAYADTLRRTGCVRPGTYYVMVWTCNPAQLFVTPTITITEIAADRCETAAAINVGGAGTQRVAAQVTCHSIGEGYGEDGSFMDCLAYPGATGAELAQSYQSTWFRFDITSPTDTFNLTPALTSSGTNVPRGEIRYRLMSGSCAALNAGTCFTNGGTSNTLECLGVGSYYIQMVYPQDDPLSYRPVHPQRTIEMDVRADRATRGCRIAPTCQARALFTFEDLCGDSLHLVNQSTFGDSIRYAWSFGNGQPPSTRRSPGLRVQRQAAAYTVPVRLIVTNTVCHKADTFDLAVRVEKAFAPPALPRTLGGCTRDALHLFVDTTGGYSLYAPEAGTVAPDLYFWQSGLYTIETSRGACVRHDTIQVQVDQIYFDLGPDLTLCPGGQAVLYLPDTAGLQASWRWSVTGAVLDSIAIARPGLYWLEVERGTCRLRDTVRVEILSAQTRLLGGDTALCPGQYPFTILSLLPADGYSWRTPGGTEISTDPTLTAAGPGRYILTATLGACTASDTIALMPGTAPRPRIDGPAALCGAATATLTAPPGYAHYRWQPGGTGDTLQAFTVTGPGLYRVTATTATGCQATDSLRIGIAVAPLLALTGPATLCPGQQGRIAAGPGFAHFRWMTASPADTLPVLAITAPGLYRLEAATAEGCLRTDSIRVGLTAAPPLSLAGPDSLCPGATATLRAGGPSRFAHFAWQTGSPADTLAVLTVSASGRYILAATTPEGCQSADTVQVRAGRAPSLRILGPDSLCPGTTATLTASPGFAHFAWQTGSPADTLPALAAGPGVHILLARQESGCAAADTHRVEAYTLPPARITGDTLLCAGAAGHIALPGFAHYRWVQGSRVDTAPTRAVTPSTQPIQVTARTARGCPVAKTLTVAQRPRHPMRIAGPAALCLGDTVVLTAGPAPAEADSLRYRWTIRSLDSSSYTVPTAGPSLALTRPGQAVLLTTDRYGCLDTTAAFTLAPASRPVGLRRDTSLCAGLPWAVAMPPGPSYTWHADSGNTLLATGERFTLTRASTYLARSGQGCQARADTFRLAYDAVPPDAPRLTGLTDTVCQYEEAQVIVDASPARLLAAATAYAVPVRMEDSRLRFTPNQPGIDSLLLTLEGPGGCQARFAYPMQVEPCAQGLFVPTGFTPGADGINDAWTLRGLQVTQVQVELYNRWGQVVYQASDWDEDKQSLRAPWRGLYRGKDCPSGSYTYYIRYTVLQNGHPVPTTKTGSLLIIR